MDEDPLSRGPRFTAWALSLALVLQSVVPAYATGERSVLDAIPQRVPVLHADALDARALPIHSRAYSSSHASPAAPGIILAFSNNGIPTDPQLLQTRKYQPVNGDVQHARDAYVAISEQGKEFFVTPTWLAKGLFKVLQRAGFAVAQIDIALTDIANGQPATIPANLQGNVIQSLLEQREVLFGRYKTACRDRDLAIAAQPPSQTFAQNIIEQWHARGMAPPNLEQPINDEYRELRSPFHFVFDVAIGRTQATESEVQEQAAQFENYPNIRKHDEWGALSPNIDQMLAGAEPASLHEAGNIHGRSREMARDLESVENIRHMLARREGILSGTIFPVPQVDKQMRPTCTVNTLRGMMAALGNTRDLSQLVSEARQLLRDPMIGMTTAFNYARQVQLFQHYGEVQSASKDTLFDTLLGLRRNIKVMIEYGDPVFKHSVVLEGFYLLDGLIYVSLRDYESHFPVWMKVTDFAKVLIPDSALLFTAVFQDGPRVTKH